MLKSAFSVVNSVDRGREECPAKEWYQFSVFPRHKCYAFLIMQEKTGETMKAPSSGESTNNSTNNSNNNPFAEDPFEVHDTSGRTMPVTFSDPLTSLREDGEQLVNGTEDQEESATGEGQEEVGQDDRTVHSGCTGAIPRTNNNNSVVHQQVLPVTQSGM